MPVPKLPPLTPDQVIELQDELLANADRLLSSALALLEVGHVGLARSLAILGMEESGKAIAIFERRVEIAYADEGEPFVDTALAKLWANHGKKLELVHTFLVDEKYWFGTELPDTVQNEAYLGVIQEWVHEHNVLKQRGFYVDVTVDEGVLSPPGVADRTSLADIIGHVHQIGWQLRLGEHIEAKSQAERARDVPASTEAEIEQMHESLAAASADEDYEWLFESMRQDKPGIQLHNDAYRVRLPGPDVSPLEKLGKLGYEAQTRELAALAERLDKQGQSEE